MRIRRDGGERGGEERGRKRRRREEEEEAKEGTSGGGWTNVAGRARRHVRPAQTTPTCDCEGVFRETSVLCEKKNYDTRMLP